MVEENPRPEGGPGRTRADGRRQLLVYLDPEVIAITKKAAIDRQQAALERSDKFAATASGIVEEALREWHAKHAGADTSGKQE